MSKRYTTATIDVDVYIGDFDTADLIDELENRKLDDDDIERLSDLLEERGGVPTEGEIHVASAELTAGRLHEALVWLERALPYPWRGVLTRLA